MVRDSQELANDGLLEEEGEQQQWMALEAHESLY